MDKPPKTISINMGEAEPAKFPPHGRYSGQLVGRVMTDEAAGPFNREAVLTFRERAAPHYAQARAAGKFVILTTYRESMLMSPDAIDELAKTVVDFVASDIAPAAVAYVAAPEVEGRGMMARIMQTKVFGPCGVPFQLFDDVASAQQWLSEQLAILDD